MSDQNANNTSRRLWGGEPGDGLFWRRVVIGGFPPNELPLFYERVSEMHDDRLLAIVGALLIENRVDRLLGAFLPRYSRLTELNEFSLSLKIRLLEAASFIPRNIPRAAHILREIRNMFAHNLNIERFDQLDLKVRNRLIALHNEVWRGLEPPGPTEDPEVAFDGLFSYCLTGLDIYWSSVKSLRDEIETDAFEEKLAARAEALTIAEYTKMFGPPPRINSSEHGTETTGDESEPADSGPSNTEDSLQDVDPDSDEPQQEGD